ncbi:right-handed parallel beta-helix repeat-containing protein [Paenibacillus sp. GSMTC-2017]|uniref:right-handed parallel beta-helix repeat-containing protein n=1 Tax=Paenibacillus sp. GSMTC-2017 TaxID=2794350 RepID=UPI0018D7C362|nr:right-handed parallel beta-helix repeat-containing protein [Paenibacillus sp. GSMTC-2017]MBH5318463.1 right-handed parallel beta-helix repeat-containing protein [Paenibacillus sp. GSMTC-2017]
MAIIEVFPGSQTAIRDAVALAVEGDVILVHKGTYHENVKIRSDKNNLRIIAKHKHRAVLDGRFILQEAFGLNNVAGVEISGFKIKNYLFGGIRISNGKSHRILENEVSKISGVKGEVKPFGIYVNRSVGNLLMRNKIERIGNVEAGSGIQISNSKGNWVLRNRLLNHSLHGLDIGLSFHNAIVGNRISGNKSDGIMISGSDNNLFFNNKLKQNRDNGVFARSNNNFIIDSKVKGNQKNGLLFTFNYNMALNNGIKNNERSGVAVFSDFNDIQQNKVEKNGNNGVFIHDPHTANLVLENRFKSNKPKNIKDQGKNNNIVQND